MRSSAATALLAAGGTLVGLALAEGLVRAVRPDVRQPFQVRLVDESERGKFCEYHPTLGWIGRPNVDDVYESFDCRHHVHQNALGFRGRDIGFPRTPARRLVVLGDSFAWGFGVEDDQIFSAVLEHEATAPLEVVNLGVSGYGTDQELLLWQTLGRRFQPDLVLLLVTPYTDVFDVLEPVRHHLPKPLFRLASTGPVLTNVPVPRGADGRWDVEGTQRVDLPGLSLLRLASHSAVVSAALLAATASPGIRMALERRSLISDRLPGAAVEQKLLVTPLPEDTQRGWTMVVALIGLLADDVARTGGSVAVATVPTPAQVYPELWDGFRSEHPAPAGTTWDVESPGRTVAEACAARGIPVVDLLPGLREAAVSDPYLYYRWNMHWTAAGHRAVARTIARALGR